MDSHDDEFRDDDAFGDAEIFFGSKRVGLKCVSGRAIHYVHENYIPGTDDASVARTLSRARPIEHSDGGHPVVLPCMPCLDQVPRNGAVPSEDVSSWPELLRRPLLKVPAAETDIAAGEEPLTAFASGTRSATVRIGTGWYRLKGCGNNDEGFVVREGETKGVKWRDIRGAAFEHTAICESYMGMRLAAHMEPLGIRGANEPLGYYLYDAPNQPLGTGFVPACIVEKTVGDRRFGTHVLAGIELLFDRLVDADSIDVPALLACFPSGRPRVPEAFDAPYGITRTSTLMSDHCLAVMYDTGTNGLTYDVPRDERVFACVLGHDLPQRVPDASLLPLQFFGDSSGGKEGEGVKEADLRWGPSWARACNELQMAVDAMDASTRKTGGGSSPGSILAYLFSRFGYECGRFARELHKGCRVSWGTYADAMCHEGQLHCNAHNNNLVVIAPGQQGGPSDDSYLAYLDLDMAFDRETYVDAWKTGKVGASPTDFDALLRQENANLMEVMAGADTTSGVPRVARSVVDAHPPALQLAKIALYDTMMLSYIAAYENNAKYPVAPYDATIHAGGYALIKLAIICQAEYVA